MQLFVRDGDAPGEEARRPSAPQDGTIVRHRFAQGRMALSGLLTIPSDLTFLGLHPDSVSPVSLALNKTFCLSFPWLLRCPREARGLEDVCLSKAL